MSANVLWRPPRSAFEESHLARFSRRLGFDPGDYDTLHRWSVAKKGEFWRAVWDYSEAIGEPGDIAFRPSAQAPMTGVAFFPGGQLNLAENLLRGDASDLAVIAADEEGGFTTMTRSELRRETARIRGPTPIRRRHRRSRRGRVAQSD